MASRQIVLLGKPPASVIEANEADLTAAKTQAAGDDDTVSSGRGANVILLVDAAKCVSVYLPAFFIKTFDIVQPAIGEAQFFSVQPRIEETEGETESTRKTRTKRTRVKTTDLSKVSYNHIKFATDGFATRPVRNRTSGNQTLKYLSARFPRILTSDCLNWFVVNAFGGGAETERKLPTHFLYAGSNARVDVISPMAASALATYTV